MPTDTTPAAPARLPELEFIALMAMVMGMVAFSVDSMLPALPAIAAELSPAAPNRAQLIVTSFVFGMGAGTFVTGPLSDRFGRKPVILAGVGLYMAGALLAWQAPALETMLGARFVQGLGAAAPRVVALALIRDLYSGRQMARTLSFVMTVFTLVPALAPTLGHYIIVGFGWRASFLTFVLFAAIATTWLFLRQPETLPPERRRRLHPAELFGAVREMLSHPDARRATLVQTLGFGMLFATLSSAQQLYDAFGQGANFHLWFGLVAVIAATSNLFNARLVVRLGMRPLIKAVLGAQMVISALMAASVLLFDLPAGLAFPLFVAWHASIFWQNGMTIGNLNALALEPMAHIAGIAASVIAAVSTVGAVLLAVPIGLAFDGTPLPLAVSVCVLSGLGLWQTSKIRRDSDVEG
ncbi:multidrug (bicyclomycin) efflux pump, Major facilitator superfamily protein (MFS) [Oceanicola granulosus HTCC2516]|uniref:Bcr/CflA family efflux transporter n=1 Tax=Oceanicola granulosus (strain ATCC BAA-861 / DSM 15982 / KCTC 12143 / HTCC2516) TaxID=314256 RepID=Q2CD17_OCEGH|nr:multidrug effflux MFS transporter [Oceanicola granulosus]EAR50559.1 multidrug (bicyclomycin) efflux pump, Major facilitator superfamily protein (MFS) [Oceanicola granulosus HTCC2516]